MTTTTFPFATATYTQPFVPPVAFAATGGGEKYAYTLLKSGPEVSAEEVELVHVQAVEVLVSWGGNVLHVAHLTPPRNFYVGEGDGKLRVCDVLLPSELIGAQRWPLVLADASSVALVIPAGAAGFIELAGGERLPLDVARERGQVTSELAGARRFELPSGAKARLELAGFVFHVGSVNAGRPLKKGVAAGWDWTLAAYFGLSFLTHASLLSLLAFFIPPLGLMPDEDMDRDRLYTMQAYLDAAAERERERMPVDSATSAEQEGGTGTQAQGEQGAMGSTKSTAKNMRYAVKGPKDNPDPHLARAAALDEAAHFGVVSLLTGDPFAPTARFGRDTALGTDEVSANGSMWGDQIGEGAGTGGLGLLGTGEGGGGRGEGVGMGEVGTLGQGRGLGTGQGWGNGHGNLGGAHTSRVPVMHPGVTTVSGRLPPEVIQRVVRQNFGRFRACYQMGLTRNPNLEGRVVARFVIGRDGAVSTVANGGSDLPDSAVVSCVVSAFYGLSFPEPQNGIVSVSYPIMLSPG